MKKIISLILATVLLAFCFVSCGEKPEPVETELDLSEYRIITPEYHTKEEEKFFNSFYSSICAKTGLNFEYTDDLINENFGYVETEREILIGKTNRKESTIEATEGENSYEIKYVNKKIVIIAENPLAIEDGLNKFLDDFVKEGETKIDVPSVKGVSTAAYYKELEKLTLTALGDSYFKYSKDNAAPENRWLNLLADKYGMKLNNKGIGGSTIAISDVEGHNPMTERLDDLPKKTDIILFEGGANDRNCLVPLGNDLNSRDKETYTGAVNYVLDDLQERYPDALIICITPWRYDAKQEETGLTNNDYAHRMIEICARRGVVCFDATDQKTTGVFMNSEDFRTNYCYSKTDYHHLNPAGMKKVMPVFEKFIGEQYREFLKSKGQ